MSNIRKLAHVKNLRLAWNQILSAGNYKYKKYFREMYNTYDVAIDENLKHLSQRLNGGSYNPKEPTIIYEPKPNGFIRPITFLTLEDQIVFQAIANLYAEKFSEERKKYEGISVFSNILDRNKDTIYFFEKWIDSYNNFQLQSQNIFLAGSVWMMDFDLAAFYDTISHEILIKKLLPRKQNELKELIQECLQMWTTNVSTKRGHGIPQGPIASDFLAEILLLEIDEALLKNNIVYVRYADDFRFFDFSKHSVLQHLHTTDILCKKYGLIPQNNKVSIRKIKSIDDFKTFEESGDPNEDDENVLNTLSKEESEKIFFESVNEESGQLLIKSNIKYVLRRSESSIKIKKFLLKNLTRNLQFTEEIFTYFENYIADVQVLERAKGLLSNRFDFVRGHAWFYLAKSILAFGKKDLNVHIKQAIAEVQKDSDNTISRLGAYLFLLRADQLGYGKYSNFLISEPSWFNKAALVTELPTRILSNNTTIKNFYGKNHFEPSMMLGIQLLKNSKSHLHLGIKTSLLKSQTKNFYKEIGVIKSTQVNLIDPIGEILHERYNILSWIKWKYLLGSEYDHALGILKQGDRLYLKSRDKWLANQDSFNNLVFLEMIKFLKKSNINGGNVNLLNRTGQLNSFGSLIKNQNDFTRTYPEIAAKLTTVHERRNNLPGSHPYNLKNYARTQPLRDSERAALTDILQKLYEQIIQVFDIHFERD